jgi:DNA-binding CsgD family transcriptional regulator
VRFSSIDVDELFHHDQFPGNWERVLQDIQALEPETTSILTWRYSANESPGDVESLVLGPSAETITSLATAILEGTGGEAGSASCPRRFDGEEADGVIGPFKIAAGHLKTGQIVAGEAAAKTATYYHCTALDLGDGLDARLAVCQPGSSDAAADVISTILAPQRDTLRRALRSLLDYRAAVEQRHEMTALADVVADPALLVTRDGRLLAANSKARMLIDEGLLANLARDGRLTLLAGEHAAALRRALAALGDQPASGPAALRLSDVNDAAQHWLLVSASGEGRFALTFKTIADGDLVPLPALMRAFDLTRTEAQLVAALTAGQSIKDYSQSIGRTENTVRWHFGNVLQKMGCRKQADVVRLVLRLLAT